MASETKFTPGPWEVDGLEVWATSPIRFNLTNVGTPMIALVSDHKNTDGGFPFGANARLIAAAPELLHVAQMVYDAEMDWRSEGHQSIPDSALETIRAAIAKATGEQE